MAISAAGITMNRLCILHIALASQHGAGALAMVVKPDMRWRKRSISAGGLLSMMVTEGKRQGNGMQSFDMISEKFTVRDPVNASSTSCYLLAKADMNRLTPLLIATLATAIFVGCATQPGPVSVGQGVYIVERSKRGLFSTAPVRATALADAKKYCEERGKVMIPVKIVRKTVCHVFDSTVHAEVYFKYLPPDDPEVKDPPYVFEIGE